MWFKIFLASIIAVLLSINVSTATAEETSAQNQSAAQPTNAQQTDAQIFGVVIAINKDEIDAAKLADAQSSNSAVLKFAKDMQRDHSKNLKAATDLANKLSIQPVDSDTSTDLQKSDSEEAAKLKTLSGAQFDQEYANAMVKGHTDALAFLDKAISQAQNPKVVTFLKDTRKTVAHHLKMAQELAKKVSQSQ